jgi:hypothetical protein
MGYPSIDRHRTALTTSPEAATDERLDLPGSGATMVSGRPLKLSDPTPTHRGIGIDVAVRMRVQVLDNSMLTFDQSPLEMRHMPGSAIGTAPQRQSTSSAGQMLCRGLGIGVDLKTHLRRKAGHLALQVGGAPRGKHPLAFGLHLRQGLCALPLQEAQLFLGWVMRQPLLFRYGLQSSLELGFDGICLAVEQPGLAVISIEQQASQFANRPWAMAGWIDLDGCLVAIGQHHAPVTADPALDGHVDWHAVAFDVGLDARMAPGCHGPPIATLRC